VEPLPRFDRISTQPLLDPPRRKAPVAAGRREPIQQHRHCSCRSCTSTSDGPRPAATDPAVGRSALQHWGSRHWHKKRGLAAAPGLPNRTQSIPAHRQNRHSGREVKAIATAVGVIRPAPLSAGPAPKKKAKKKKPPPPPAPPGGTSKTPAAIQGPRPGKARATQAGQSRKGRAIVPVAVGDSASVEPSLRR